MPYMPDKLKNVPHPGLRNIKTCITIVLILIFYRLINREGAALALVAGIVCMQDSIDKSIRLGIDRLKGTFMGGLFGVIFALLKVPEMHFALFLLCVFFGIMLFIFLCNLLRAKSSIVIGCIVFFVIILDTENLHAPVAYALNRTLDTVIGIVLAFIVNQLIFRPKPELYRGRSSANPFFNYEIHHADNQKAMGWKGEETTELYIYPESKVCEDRNFDFRLSVSKELIEKSSFYKFPGYKRHTMLLNGKMFLSHSYKGAARYSIHLSKYEVDCFKGKWDTSCIGLGTNLCLMTSNSYTGSMEPVFSSSISDLKNDRFEGFYILQDNLTTTFVCNDQVFTETLNKGDFAMVGWYTNGNFSYSVSFSESSPPASGEALAIKISCSKDQYK